MEQLRLSLARWLGLVPRQTSIGLKVPYPKPKSKDDALANLEYARRELEVCDKSIACDDESGELPRLIAKRLMRYVDVAILVAKDAEVQDALALSQAALWVLPRLNPYAEMFYDCSDSCPNALENDRALRRLADEYEYGVIKLGRVIIAVNPEIPSLDPMRNETLKEDYGSLEHSFVPE